MPIPWTRAGQGLGFSRTDDGACPAEPWLPQPPDWGRYSVESQLADERSFLVLYRSALRLRRDHPALGRGTLRWLDAEGLLCFAVFRVHGGGLIGVVSTFGTARRVADALRRSPEFRSL